VQKLQTALHAKAKEMPTCRFYALYDKLYREDILAHAWRLAKANGGAAGVDGQTFRDIEEYGVGRWLGELAEDLRTKTYRPQPVRRVYIPKPDGRKRPLGISTIRDRVAQTAHPRFIVTSLHTDVIGARQLYEDVYCKRGEMENRIKETQSDLFGDRMPATTMRANQLRMWFSAIAYVLMCVLRRIALAGTEMERATRAIIGLRLLKIGAQVTVSVRRVKVALATGCPYQELFTTAYARLSSAAR
jgi:hypothetical protein